MLKRINLLNGVSATGAGVTVHVVVPTGVENFRYAVRGIGTATVELEGSIDGTNWASLKSVTSDEGGLVTAFPYMRANITSYGSGTIFADLLAANPPSSI